MPRIESFRRGVLLYLVAFFALINIFVWVAVVHEEGREGLTIAFLNVGQGDSIFIESPTGVQVLIDGGPGTVVLRELGKLLPFYDRSIDAIVVTNPDKDHIAGLIDVLERYRIDLIMEPGTRKDTGVYADLLRHEKEEGAARFLARRGQVLDLGGGAELHILYPDKDVSHLSPNDGSVVAMLTYGSSSVLLMGDATAAVERHLVALDGERLDTDILKVGHHGSRTSTSEALLKIATPAVAVAMLGKENRYGHPHQDVMNRLSRFNIPFLRTDRDGTVIFRSDGRKFVRTQ